MNIAFGRTVKSIRDFDLAQTIATQFKRIEREDYIAFLWAVFFGLLAHGMALVSFFVNEDGQNHRGGALPLTWQLGRWLIKPVRAMHEYLPFQFPAVLLLIILIAIVGVIMAHLLKARTLWSKSIIASLLVTYPAFSVVISYHIAILSYTLSCFLAITSVWLAYKGKYHLIFGGILLALSLSIYQAYITVPLAICIAILLRVTQETDFRDKAQLLYLIKKGFALFIYLILAGIFYLLSVKISKWYYGGELSSYKGADQIGSITLTPYSIVATVRAFADFFSGRYMNMHTYLLLGISGLLLLALTCLVISIVIKRPFSLPPWIKLGICAALIGGLIPAIFIFPIIAPTAAISQMQTFGMVVILALAIALLSDYRGLLKNTAIALSLLILLGFINRANALHYQSYLYTQASFLSANRLLSRIEALPEFSPDSKIAVIGKLPNERYRHTGTPPFDEKSQGWFGGPVGFQHANRSYKFTNIVGYMDYKLQPANTAECEKAESLALDMPVFPAPGSVKAFDNLIVVKLNHCRPEIKMTQKNAATYEFSALLKEPLTHPTFAWYVKKKSIRGYKKIDTIWYKPSNTLCYTFKESGTYLIEMFYKDDAAKGCKNTYYGPIEVNIAQDISDSHSP